MAKRMLMVAAIAAATVLALSACSSSGNPTPSSGSKRLVQVIGSDPDSLNPNLSSVPQNRQIGCMIYQGLVRVDKNFTPQPQLAKSWDISEDGLTYTFKLQTATWTDGKPLTAHDVAYSLTEVAKLSPGYGSSSASRVASVDEIDDSTVRIQLKEPFAPLLQSLSCDQGGAAILPSHLFEGTDPATNAASTDKPVGTGPFMLKSWQRGSQITLVKNPDYWRKGAPHLDEVITKVIPSASSRMLSLLAGQVDYVYHYWVDRNSLSPVTKNSKYQVVPAGAPGDFVMVTNVRNAPFDQVKVRQALFQAIDREFLISGPMKGYGAPGTSAISTEFKWAYNPDVNLNTKYPYDPDAARKLLAKAGVADGSLTVRLAFDSSNPALKSMAEAISEFWGKIGVKTNLQGSELTTALDQVFKQWNFDVSLWGFTYGADPATGIARLYVSSSIGKAVYNNASGYSNPEVDKLWAEGAAQPVQKDRVKPYHEVQEMLERDVPSAPLVQVPNMDAGLKSIRGMWTGLDQYGDWWDGVSIK